MYRMQDSSVVDLCHPEFLSCSVLTSLLKERNIQNVEGLNKDQLVERFNKVLLPLPQRERYRKKERPLVSSKKCSEHAQHDNNPATSVTPVVSQKRSFAFPSFSSKLLPRTISLLHISEPQSRLKPPPTITGKKVVKLNSSPASDNGVISLKRSSTSVASEVHKRVQLTISPPASNGKSEANNKNIRSAPPTNEEMPPRKKHKPITWP